MSEKPHTKKAGEPSSEKLQKALATLGLGSRREIETWISDGRIKIGTRLAKLGDRVSAHDKLFIDDRLVRRNPEKIEAPRVLVYHKPEGEICTRKDEQERKTVFERLPVIRGQRWIMVGRLDINTSGLLMFTTDGELANRMMHPSSGFEREYAVRILGTVDELMCQRLLKGVTLEDGPAHFEKVIDAGGTGANHWFHVVVSEGRNRLVRRLWESQGVVVSRLMRIRYGNITLPKGLARGRYQELNDLQIAAIKKGMSV